MRAYVGLGANLGNSAATLRAALNELAATEHVQVHQVSPFYRSAPIDAPGPAFINAVAALDTTLAPLALLDVLQVLEHRHARQRTYRNAPRTLDLDLLIYEQSHFEHPRLILPHPRLHERAFVLRPLKDVAPELILAQGSFSQLLNSTSHQAIERL